MAPELLERLVNLTDIELFKRVDVYALALVYWEMANRCEAEQGGCSGVLSRLRMLKAEGHWIALDNWTISNGKATYGPQGPEGSLGSWPLLLALALLKQTLVSVTEATWKLTRYFKRVNQFHD